MKTEAELKEFYYDVIHSDHSQPIDFYTGSVLRYRIYSEVCTCVCMFRDDVWYIRSPRHLWYAVGDYISDYRSYLSDADKLALILKYT